MTSLDSKLRTVFALLKKTQPTDDASDVTWWGPYVILRRGQWCPSRFTLYGGVLYSRLIIPPGYYGLSWTIGSHEVTFETDTLTGDYDNGDELWGKALTQIAHRLASALTACSRYNRFVERRLPLTRRWGKIRRELTWPRGAKRPVSLRQLQHLERALDEATKYPQPRRMTLAQYLNTAAVAYDAGFRELRAFSPRQKYQKKADGRYGGLLNLPPHDATAFEQWFHSPAWSGCHPWEIVFGHPHGIMLAPRYHPERRSWSYWLWVDALGWYVTAARMAVALGAHRIPFELQNHRGVLDTLYGRDDVDVGPELSMVSYGELKRQQPESVGSIRWAPIPEIHPITSDQLARVKQKGARHWGTGIWHANSPA